MWWWVWILSTHTHTHTPKYGDSTNHRLTTVSVLLSLHWCVCHARDILRFCQICVGCDVRSNAFCCLTFLFCLLRLVRWFGRSSDTEIATFAQHTCGRVCVAAWCKTQNPVSALLCWGTTCALVEARVRLEKIHQFDACPNLFIAYFLLNLFHTAWGATVYILMTRAHWLHQQAPTPGEFKKKKSVYTRLRWTETFQAEVFRQGSTVGYLRPLKQNIWHGNSCGQSEAHIEALTTFGQKFQIYTESSSSSSLFFFQWELRVQSVLMLCYQPLL